MAKRSNKKGNVIINSNANCVHFVAGVQLAPGQNFVSPEQKEAVEKYFDYLDDKGNGSGHIRPLFSFVDLSANSKGKFEGKDKSEKAKIVSQLMHIHDMEIFKQFVDSMDEDLMEDDKVAKAVDRKLSELEKIEAKMAKNKAN